MCSRCGERGLHALAPCCKLVTCGPECVLLISAASVQASLSHFLKVGLEPSTWLPRLKGGGERRGSLPPLHMSRVSCIKPSSDQRHPWSGFVAQVWFESFPYNMEPGSSLWEVSGKEFPSKIEIWVRATDTLFLAVYMRNALQNHLHAITILDFRCIYDAAATFSTICVYAHYFVRFWTEMGPPGCPRAWS